MKETLYTFLGFEFTAEYMTMWAGIFTGLTTILFIRESYLMRRAQNTPEISMYLKFAETTPTLLLLFIENIGTGVASNVKFEILKNYNHYSRQDDDLAEVGIIKSGLENFYPKQTFKYFINFTASNWDEKKNEEIIIQVSYDLPFFRRKRKTYSMTLEQYAGGRHFNPGDTYIAHITLSIEKMQKDIGKLVKNFEKESQE